MSAEVVTAIGVMRFGGRRDVAYVSGWGTAALIAAGAALGFVAYRSRSIPAQSQTLRFEGRDVFVYVPEGLRRSSRRVLIYFHGNGATIGDVRSRLASVFDRAVPTLVIVPQLDSDGSAGSLNGVGGIRRLLTSAFDAVGIGWDADTVNLRVVSHSGGYVSAAAAIDRGGVAVREIGLLDSLYARADVFARGAIAAAHLVNIYGPTTADQSLALARTLEATFGSEATCYCSVRSLPSLDEASIAEMIATHRATTMKSAVAHGDVPSRYLAAVLAGFGS